MASKKHKPKVTLDPLSDFTDENLAECLRERGWRVYPRERVQVMDYTTTAPLSIWKAKHKEGDASLKDYMQRRVAEALGYSIWRRGAMVFDYQQWGHTNELWIRGQCGVIMPRPLEEKKDGE